MVINDELIADSIYEQMIVGSQDVNNEHTDNYELVASIWLRSLLLVPQMVNKNGYIMMGPMPDG